MRKFFTDPVLLILAAGICFAVMLQSAVREPVFFSGDAGIKLLMTRQLAEGQTDLGLQLPGAAWVRELWAQGYNPFKKPFVHDIGGRLIPAFPLAFPLATAPLYKLFGLRGLYILPFTALLTIWLCVYFFSLRLQLRLVERAFVMAALVFASYATLYSAMFWEHLPAVALSTLGCCAVLRRDNAPPGLLLALAGGLLMGISGWLRPEGSIFFGAVSIVWGWESLCRRQWKPWLCFAVGGSAAVAVFFAANLLLYGYSLGPHAIDVMVDRNPAARLAAMPGIAVELFNALLLFAPLCVPAFIYALRARAAKTPALPAVQVLAKLALIGLIFFAGVALIVPNSGGLQWGPRYLLHIVPLGAVAAGLLLAAARELGSVFERRLVVGCACLLLAYGIWQNTYQGWLALVDNYRNRVAPALRYLQQQEPVPVVCFDQYVPQELAWLVYRQPFFIFPDKQASDSSMLALVEKIFKAGQSKFFFIATNYASKFSDMPPLRIPGPSFTLLFQPVGSFGAAYYIYEVTIAS